MVIAQLRLGLQMRLRHRIITVPIFFEKMVLDQDLIIWKVLL